jgi:hypothetical protein
VFALLASNALDPVADSSVLRYACIGSQIKPFSTVPATEGNTTGKSSLIRLSSVYETFIPEQNAY